MILPVTHAVLWLLGFALVLSGAARFGWHTAAIVGGIILLKCAGSVATVLAKGWKQ